MGRTERKAGEHSGRVGPQARMDLYLDTSTRSSQTVDSWRMINGWLPVMVLTLQAPPRARSVPASTSVT
jgi:hypothetical protein